MNRKKREQKAVASDQTGVTDSDEERITALFMKSREGLERYLRSRLGGSPEEAEELAQEAYLRLITRRKRRVVTHWEALLFCTARNLANNRIKQRQIRRAAAALIRDDITQSPAPDSSCSDGHDDSVAQRALAKLPQRARAVLAGLREGLSYPQIAKQLGVHERTCRRDVQQARLVLQKMKRHDQHE